MSRQIATSPFSLPKVHICLIFLFCLAYFCPGLERRLKNSVSGGVEIGKVHWAGQEGY